MSAIAGGVGIGAGVGVSSVALAPFNAANTFMGSAFFGYGMILGERYMYQADWPKIQQRLENGEKIENIIQEYTGTFTAVVMQEAKIIFETVTKEFIAIMQEALSGALPTVTGTQLTPEQERRRSRGGGTIQQPAPRPAPTQPIPSQPITQKLGSAQIKQTYMSIINAIQTIVTKMDTLRATPKLRGISKLDNFPPWASLKNLYILQVKRLNNHISKYANDINLGGYLQQTPFYQSQAL